MFILNTFPVFVIQHWRQGIY